jgi:DNA-binding beta-propeller fold protein YncE
LILNPDDGNFYSLTKEGIYTIHMHGEQRGQITGPISVGDPTQSPREMAYNPTDSRLYVLKSGEYKIVPRPDLNHCYFDADWCNSLQAEQHCTPGSINVVDTVTNEEDTSIPNFDIDCPAGIAFTPRGEIFVTQDYREYGANNHCPPQDGTVFILDRNLDIIDFVRVGPCPSKISYDNLNGNMYVYNAKATLRDELNAISIISTIHPSIQSLATALVDNSNGQTFAHNALVPYGTKIQQGATISVAWDPYVQYYLPPTPTGTILYYRAAGNCEDAAFDISRGVPVPIDPKNAYYTLSPVSNLVNSKTVSFIAKYEGNYGSVFASCKSVNVVPPQINTVIRDKDGMDVTGRTLPVGTLIHDTAVISLPGGSPPDTLPSGTVTYRRYSTIDCDETGGFIDEPPVTIANGRVPDSQVITSTIPSEVSYKAFYDDWAESHCEKGTNFK